jgi:ribose 1,5-bisphosphate isomerase
LNKENKTQLKSVYAEIDRIAADNRSGAAEILGRAREVFSLLESSASAVEDFDTEQAASLVLEVSAALVRSQPDMAPLARLASAVVRQAMGYRKSHIQPDARDLIARAAARARSFIEQSKAASARVTALAAGLIDEGAIILTHSRSSTVVAAFVEASRAGRNFQVIATESRPCLEGRTLAEEAARHAIAVTIIADAAADSVMAQADAVFFGADRVTPEFLINKTGTRMIALAARERKLPVYGLSDTTKFINPAGFPCEVKDERSGDEIWPDAPAGIRVVNRYFEPTPLDYFTGIVTEEGILSPEAARKRAETSLIDSALLVRLSS